MNRYICIHGHFYQPPRENSWLEEVEVQDSAYPYHDWNERITVECYAPNTASRILDNEKKIVNIVNNYSKISFNFGPTLLSWMQRHRPDVYKAILEADKKSQKHFSGHGSAIAQVYNHMIMPLANLQDKRTQIIWGIKDFTHRFRRPPEGMWLAETAVDRESLELMAEYGIKFTILSPYQARRTRKIGEEQWTDAAEGRVDPKIPYRCSFASGKSIAVFFYDGPTARDVAFGGLLNSGENFAARLLGLFSAPDDVPQLVNIATDGETYGHHHRFGEMALSYALHQIEAKKAAKITVYGEYLEKFPPAYEVEIAENSSWSCFHGVERWREDCGCGTGTHPGWKQNWRAPLRAAMDRLSDHLVVLFEEHAAKYVSGAWQARDEYIDVILNRKEDVFDRFLSRNSRRELAPGEKSALLKLLEMQRHGLLMYTSCGWFFDEISGIETLQVLQYAARAIQLARETCGVELEAEYLEALKNAPSNVEEYEHGADIYEKFIKTTALDLHGIGAHYAVSSLFIPYGRKLKIYSYGLETKTMERVAAGKQIIVTGRSKITSDITREEGTVSFAVLHLGEHHVICGVRDYTDEKAFAVLNEEIKEAFQQSDIAGVMHAMDAYFGPHHYSFWDLLRDEQRLILNQLLSSTLQEIEGSLRKINEIQYPLIQVLRERNIPLPKVLATTVEFILNTDIRKVLEQETIDLEKLQELAGTARRWAFEIDKTTLGFVAGKRIGALMERLRGAPEDTALLRMLAQLFRIIHPLNLPINLWSLQNIYFSIGKMVYNSMAGKARADDAAAKQWLEHFDAVGDFLRVRSV